MRTLGIGAAAAVGVCLGGCLIDDTIARSGTTTGQGGAGAGEAQSPGGGGGEAQGGSGAAGAGTLTDTVTGTLTDTVTGTWTGVIDVEPQQVSALWSVALGGNAWKFTYPRPHGGVDDQGNTFVTATFWQGVSPGGEAVLVKLDPSGSVVWEKSLPRGKYESWLRLDVGAGGDLALASDLWTSIDLGSGPVVPPEASPQALFVARLDSSGDPLWIRTSKEPTPNIDFAPAQLASGSVVATGPISGFVTAGALPTTPGIVALDTAGAPLWSLEVESPVELRHAADEAGNLYILTLASGPIDFGGGPVPGPAHSVFLAKVDPSGAHVWNQRIGRLELEPFADVHAAVPAPQIDAAGNILLAGTFAGSFELGGQTWDAEGTTDVFVAKLTASGDVLWTKVVSGPQAQKLGGLAAHGSDVMVSLSSPDTVDLGGGPIGGGLSGQNLLARLGPGGQHLWSKAEPPQLDIARFVATPSGDMVIARRAQCEGSANRQLAFARVQPDGQVASEIRVGDCQQDLSSVEWIDAATDGGLIFAGTYEGALDLGAGPLPPVAEEKVDVFVAKVPLP